jgi:hypothetical protein
VPELEEPDMKTLIRLLAPVALAALAAGPAPAAAPLKSDSVVKATAVAGTVGSDGKQTVTLTLAIDKGWHLYANPVGNEDLTSVQTAVKAAAKGSLGDVKVDYPPGKKIKDPVLGEYSIYEDKAVIAVNVTRAGGDDSPVELTVRVQACSEKECLLPAEIKVAAAP